MYLYIKVCVLYTYLFKSKQNYTPNTHCSYFLITVGF